MAMIVVAGRAAGRAVWEAVKRVGKVVAERPEDTADVAWKVGEIWQRARRGDVNTFPSQLKDPLPLARVPVIDPSRFVKFDKVKLLEALMGAGLVYSVHMMDVSTGHGIAKDKGMGLFLAVGDLANVPSLALTRTSGIVPSEVASAASLVAGPVCPGLIPTAYSQFPCPSPGFNAAGFLLVILLPVLASLLDD